MPVERGDDDPARAKCCEHSGPWRVAIDLSKGGGEAGGDRRYDDDVLNQALTATGMVGLLDTLADQHVGSLS